MKVEESFPYQDQPVQLQHVWILRYNAITSLPPAVQHASPHYTCHVYVLHIYIYVYIHIHSIHIYIYMFYYVLIFYLLFHLLLRILAMRLIHARFRSLGQLGFGLDWANGLDPLHWARSVSRPQ